MSEISDWSDWFHLCSDAISPCKTYEELTWKYHRLMRGRRDAALAQTDYADKHRMHFWRTRRPIPAFVLTRACLVSAICMIVAVALVLVATGVSSLLSDPLLAGHLPLPVRPNDPASALVSSLGRIITLGILAFAVVVGIFVTRRLLLTTRLSALERRLREPLGLVPPSYRNSFCLAAFDEMFRSYGVGTMASALDTCDRYISANAATYVPIVLMYDLAYGGEGKRDIRLAGEEAVEDEPDASDSNLPSDIKTKVKRGSVNPDSDLTAMIGMDNVKRQIRQLKNRLQFSGGKASTGGNNLVFMGPAGVGKTVTARIVTGLLYEMGYIRRNRIVEIDGDYLKSPYQGQTGVRTQAVINYAVGGVLFIDEAYLLASDRNGSAGTEAIGVLLKAMEDMRDELVVILAGYEDPMTRLLASNEGFRSRVRHTITFKSYTPDELMEIMAKFMHDSDAMRDMTIADAAKPLIREELRRESTRPGFGNARAARNALDALYDIHADRVMRGDETNQLTITEADTRQWLADQAEKAADASRQLMAEQGIDSSIISVDELRGRTHAGSEHPWADLDELVGLDGVKRQIHDLEAQVRFYANDPDKRQPVGHMVFMGPPGVGKTTTVAAVTGILFELGYLQRNQYVDVSGDFLRGSYLGQTGKRTEATISYSLGGVLFIDEAYLLASGQDGHADQYGTEAVGVLVNAMEKHLDDLVIIMAGYPTQMRQLFDINPGLKSRVGIVIDFPNYGPLDICKIFQLMCAKRGFSVERPVWQPLMSAVKQAEANPQFGNARWARQLVDASVRVHARRFADGSVRQEKRMTLDAADVMAALQEMH